MTVESLSMLGHFIIDSFLSDLCFSSSLGYILADDSVKRTFMRKVI